MRTMNFFAGFLSGAALGAVAILLTTPQSGTDLQADVKSRFDSIIDEGRRAAADRRRTRHAKPGTRATAPR